MSKKNFTISTVATAPSPTTSGTSLVVATGHGTRFATGEPAVICPVNTSPDSSNAEIVTVSNIDGDTLTIVREQESTTARDIQVGDVIFQQISAKDYNDLLTFATHTNRSDLDNVSGTNTGDDASIPIGYLDTDGTLAGDSDVKVPTQKAVKAYADGKIAKATNVTALNDTGIADGEVAVFNLTNKDIRTSNVLISTDGTLAGNVDTNLPTEKAVKTYVDGTKFVWKGVWVTSTAYVVNDVVQNDGSAYVCISGHTSGATTEAGVGASWTTVWDLLVEGLPTPNLTDATTTDMTGFLYGDGSVLTPVLDTKNYIINGNFDIAQRGTTFDSTTTPANSDDTYLLDRWNLISDGNDAVDVSQIAVADLVGSQYMLKLDTETSKRYGIVQFIENSETVKLKGKSVSISFVALSANISALRCAVLTWAGTADTVTSDIVSSWDATPTWATNWTAENTPADLTVGSTVTTIKIENIALDSETINNIALAIWTPNQETIGDIIYISQIQMNVGSKALPYMPKSYGQELTDCRRYYIKWANATGFSPHIATGQVFSATQARAFVALPTPMRIAPTTEYSNLSHLRVFVSATSTKIISALGNPSGGMYAPTTKIDLTFATGATDGGAVGFYCNDSGSWFALTAEL